MLRQYQDDPARIDRARDLLEAHLARGGTADVPTLLTLARAWFLFAEERAKSEDDKIAAYAKARDYAKRATDLAPRSADAHLWYAITLGSWSQAKGLLRSALDFRELRRPETQAAIAKLSASVKEFQVYETRDGVSFLLAPTATPETVAQDLETARAILYAVERK